MDSLDFRTLSNRTGGPLTITEIKHACAQVFGVSSADMNARWGPRATASAARACGMYVARHALNRSLNQIAPAFGLLNHTSVLHAVRRVAAEVEVLDGVMRAKLAAVLDILRRSAPAQPIAPAAASPSRPAA